jgi:uncharacterized protein
MTLLLRMVGELLWSAAVWAGILVALAAVAGIAVHRISRRTAGLRRTVMWAFVASVVTVAAAHRLRLPDPLAFTVWRRDMLPLWAGLGATAGGWLHALRARGGGSVAVATSGESSRVVEVSAVDEIARLLDDHEGTTIAVVGATDSPGKYGGIIYRDLKRKGYRVVPVNPKRDTVDGDRCYPSVADLPDPPTIVNLVVPPPVTLDVLRRCLDLGLMRVWVQPGAADAEVRRFVEDNGFTALVGACIMVEAHAR